MMSNKEYQRIRKQVETAVGRLSKETDILRKCFSELFDEIYFSDAAEDERSLLLLDLEKLLLSNKSLNELNCASVHREGGLVSAVKQLEWRLQNPNQAKK